jgi:hypothetical protein
MYTSFGKAVAIMVTDRSVTAMYSVFSKSRAKNARLSLYLSRHCGEEAVFLLRR